MIIIVGTDGADITVSDIGIPGLIVITHLIMVLPIIIGLALHGVQLAGMVIDIIPAIHIGEILTMVPINPGIILTIIYILVQGLMDRQPLVIVDLQELPHEHFPIRRLLIPDSAKCLPERLLLLW